VQVLHTEGTRAALATSLAPRRAVRSEAMAGARGPAVERRNKVNGLQGGRHPERVPDREGPRRPPAVRNPGSRAMLLIKEPGDFTGDRGNVVIYD
jgi:hypothetical protein